MVDVSEPNIASTKALVVDDDLVTRRLIKRVMETSGCGYVAEADDGEAAKALLKQHQFDLVVTDLHMPRLDGLGLMRWAAANAPGPLWVILSGVDTFDAAVDAVRLGAYEFLTKPPHIHQIEIVVRNALDQRRLTREREQLFADLEESHRSLLEKVRELEEKSEAIRRDLRRAEIIQRVLLPNQPPPLNGLSLQTVYRPGRYVGGDLYNVMRLNDRQVAIYVADATGHGVSSAMLSVLFHRKLVHTDADGAALTPAQVLTATNAAICAEQVAPGLFLTACYCLLDTVAHEATIALAGHPPAILRRADGSCQRFQRTGPALGLTSGATYQQERFAIQAGDRLLLYTDGLLESTRASSDPAWLESTLADADDDARSVIERLADAALPDQSEDADPDDITLLLLDARAGPSRFDNGSSSGHRPTGSMRRGEPTVFYGESEAGSFFALIGKGTWTVADTFHETAGGILDEGRPVTLDLANCEYLDSTFLGTIHELATRSVGRRARFQLQRVTPAVRALFEELDMRTVLGCIVTEPQPVPELQPLLPVTEPTGSQTRILRAHEQLAALSARNREKFLGVVESMRSQLAEN